MVELAPAFAERAASVVRDAPASSPWQRAFDRLRRRRGARWAAAILFLLCGAAIFAPLIASDLPYRIVAIDYGAYQSALRAVPAIANELATRAERGVQSASDAQPAFARALEGERGALELRLATLERHLDAADRAGPRELSSAADRAIRAALGGSETERATAARELRERAGELARTHAARDPRQLASSGRTLVAVASWPAFSELSALEVGFMTLWIACLALWPIGASLARRASRDRLRVAARAPRWPWIAPVLLAVAVGLLWSALAPREMLSASSALKLGLTRGDIVATSVWFPPLAMGFAETHASESFRPPTWSSASEMDEAGRYVHGPPSAGMPGFTPPALPVEVRFGEPERNAAWRHPLGTDRLGRDVLARLLHGARVSLAVGVSSAFVLLLLGLAFGALAGYCGGWIDFAISRAMEVLNSFPAFFLILCAAALVPQRTLHPLLAIVLVIAAVSWTGVARLVRAELLRLRELDFLLAARALGLRPLRILWSHALPNALAPVLVSASFAISSGILVEAAVSFLGFGVRVPVPSWGAALAEAQGGQHAWLALFPGLALFVTVLCTNVLGEALRDALDPREERA